MYVVNRSDQQTTKLQSYSLGRLVLTIPQSWLYSYMKRVTVRAFRGMSNINAMKAFMVLGDLMTKKGDELSDEAVKYKERIAFATMRASIPDWQPPSDWDSLTNKQKLDRLNKLKSV